MGNDDDEHERFNPYTQCVEHNPLVHREFLDDMHQPPS